MPGGDRGARTGGPGVARPRARAHWLYRWSLAAGALALAGCFDAALPPPGVGVGQVCAWDMVQAFRALSDDPDRRDLWVVFVDVGHGDATWLRLPGRAGLDPREVIVDVGDDGRPHDRAVPDGGRALVELMRAAGHAPGEPIDALVISHPDKDHYGGAIHVLESFPAQRWVDPGLDPPQPTWRATLAAAARAPALRMERGAPALNAAGVDRALLSGGPNGLEVRVLGGLPTAPTENDASLVVSVRFVGAHLAIMGDAGAWLERRLDLEPVDVLRVGHHGGVGTSTEAFLDRIAPPTGAARYAVVSAGGRAGLPAGETMARLRAHFGPDRVYRTDRDDGRHDARGVVDGDHILLRVRAADGQIDLCYLSADGYS